MDFETRQKNPADFPPDWRLALRWSERRRCTAGRLAAAL